MTRIPTEEYVMLQVEVDFKGENWRIPSKDAYFDGTHPNRMGFQAKCEVSVFG